MRFRIYFLESSFPPHLPASQELIPPLYELVFASCSKKWQETKTGLHTEELEVHIMAHFCPPISWRRTWAKTLHPITNCRNIKANTVKRSGIGKLLKMPSPGGSRTRSVTLISQDSL